MRRMPRDLFTWATLLAVSTMVGCNTTLVAFELPRAVWAGHDFVIAVAANGMPAHFTDRTVGCVLQVPNGFTVASHALGVRDDPALLSLYTAEAGHHLVAFSGTADQNHGWTHCVVSAPSTTGTHTFKVAMAGFAGGTSWQATDPPGVTSFASILHPEHAKTVSVIANPTMAFVHEATGIGQLQDPSLFVVDFDGDGRDDLGTDLGVYSWRADGAWVQLSTAVGSAAGDFDGDGHLDFVGPTGWVAFGDGRGGWTSTRISNRDGAAAVHDLDGDGRDEIVFVTRIPWNSAASLDAVNFYRCSAGRIFSNQMLIGSAGSSATEAPRFCRVTDLTGDGRVDILSDSCRLVQTSTGAWLAGSGFPQLPPGTGIGDLTGDGVAEIVHGMSGSGITVSVYLGNQQWGTRTLPGLPSGAFRGTTVVDYDRDGWNDIVCSGPGIEVYRNLGGGTFAPVADSGLPPYLADHAVQHTTGAAANLVVGDFQGDGLPDLAVTARLPSTLPGVYPRTPLVFMNLTTGVHAFGQGCAAPGFVSPRLDSTGQPQIGNAAFALQLRQGAPNGAGLVWFGTSKRWWNGQPVLPWPLGAMGAPGCELLADALQWHVAMLDASGTATVGLPIPNLASLRRVSCFAQGLVFRPGANPAGLLTTQGLIVRID